MIASEERAQALGVEPLGAFVGSAVAGVDPRVMGIGPVPAVRKLLERAGIDVADLDLVELNEAFASQSLVVIRELGLDPERVNVNGGAIAIGHPLGMSGARLVVTLLHELRRRGGQVRARDPVRRSRPGPGGPLRALMDAPSSTSSSAFASAGTWTGSSTRTTGRRRSQRGSTPRSFVSRPRSPRTRPRYSGRSTTTPGFALSSSGSKPSHAGSPARRSRTRTRSSAATACVRSGRRKSPSRPPTASSTSCFRATGRWPSATRRGARARLCRAMRSRRSSRP